MAVYLNNKLTYFLHNMYNNITHRTCDVILHTSRVYTLTVSLYKHVHIDNVGNHPQCISVCKHRKYVVYIMYR